MTLTCPSCREGKLVPDLADPLLPTHRCERCSGQWIQGQEYYRWLEHPDRRPADAASAQTSAVHDSRRAMICPHCGKLLSRYGVGHGLSFSIDRCGGCGGIWLDANEWQSLRQSGLSDRIHRIFSSAWQAQIFREQQERVANDRLMQRIGAADFNELNRVTDWIERHPHVSEITAFLLDKLRGLEPRREKDNPT